MPIRAKVNVYEATLKRKFLCLSFFFLKYLIFYLIERQLFHLQIQLTILIFNLKWALFYSISVFFLDSRTNLTTLLHHK